MFGVVWSSSMDVICSPKTDTVFESPNDNIAEYKWDPGEPGWVFQLFNTCRGIHSKWEWDEGSHHLPQDMKELFPKRSL